MGSTVVLPTRMDTWQVSMAVKGAAGMVLPRPPSALGSRAVVAASCNSCTHIVSVKLAYTSHLILHRTGSLCKKAGRVVLLPHHAAAAPKALFAE